VCRRLLCLALLIAALACSNAVGAEFRLRTEPYISPNLYTRPVLPLEYDKVVLRIEIPARGAASVSDHYICER
jgi:hypothetical protein